RNGGGGDIRIRDIGEAVLGPENEESSLEESGGRMSSLAIIPQPGSNHVAIADEFYKRIQQLRNDIPDDIRLTVAADDARVLKRPILEVGETLIVAVVLVVLVIYFFFRDWLSALRPLIDIPVALIGTFFIMYLAGFTINVLTLLGIV